MAAQIAPLQAKRKVIPSKYLSLKHQCEFVKTLNQIKTND